MSLAQQNEEFPILCETCLGPNPMIRMTRQDHAKACKICERPFTVYRWKAGPTGRYKKTELCRTCAKLKNVCQTCVLDLQYGLPVQVRDSVIAEEDRVQLPTSTKGRGLMIEQYEKKMAAALTAAPDAPTALTAAAADTQLATAYGKATNSSSTLTRLTRPQPYYKRNEAHLCSFYARGECNRGQLCPFRHEMPVQSDLSKQNIKDRYAGTNDPVARKMLSRVRGGGSVSSEELIAPMDPSITTLWVGGLSEAEGEADVHRLFYAYGEMRGIRMLPSKACAFVQFVSRHSAEEAARQARVACNERGWRLSWAKGRKGDRAEGEAEAAAAEGSTGVGANAPADGEGVIQRPISTLPPANFPALPPPPGMSLITYPSQNPSQSAAKFTTAQT